MLLLNNSGPARAGIWVLRLPETGGALILQVLLAVQSWWLGQGLGHCRSDTSKEASYLPLRFSLPLAGTVGLLGSDALSLFVFGSWILDSD